jgi:hypothetical protein
MPRVTQLQQLPGCEGYPLDPSDRRDSWGVRGRNRGTGGRGRGLEEALGGLPRKQGGMVGYRRLTTGVNNGVTPSLGKGLEILDSDPTFGGVDKAMDLQTIARMTLAENGGHPGAQGHQDPGLIQGR